MRRSRLLFFVLFFLLGLGPAIRAEEAPLDAARHAYEKGDYRRAIELLRLAAARDPNSGEIQLLLTKSYLGNKQFDEAVASAEKAVALDPKSSVYHQWLGEAYGGKADHSSMLSAYFWARKTKREFEIAVQLDERNFNAAQDLIEYDCTAPSLVGGGEDKARPLIQKLMELDAAEGHYGAGVCKAVKKDWTAADLDYAKALESNPRTAERVFDIGDYFLGRGQGERLISVANAGEVLAPGDPRVLFYRAAGWILKGENNPDTEKLLREYLSLAPVRSDYPSFASAHYLLGRWYAGHGNTAQARTEFQTARQLNPKEKRSEEALKRLGEG